MLLFFNEKFSKIYIYNNNKNNFHVKNKNLVFASHKKIFVSAGKIYIQPQDFLSLITTNNKHINKMPRIKESLMTVLPMNINFHTCEIAKTSKEGDTLHFNKTKTYKILRRKNVRGIIWIIPQQSNQCWYLVQQIKTIKQKFVDISFTQLYYQGT